MILDEADTLLEMGFRQEIEAIAKFLPPTPERQTFMFSATVSKQIREVARETLDRDHSFINCVSEDTSPVHAHVPQFYTVLPDASQQLPHIVRLLAHDQLTNPAKSKTIVFLPTTKLTRLFNTFVRQLSATLPAGRNTRIYEIHSLMTQQARTRTSDRFRADTSGASILVSSDVSARGVDYPGVTRVIQVGIPGTSDQYVHRVGRTGRGSDKRGRADLVLLPWEAGFVSWQLSSIPLNSISVSDLASQVDGLAQSHDSDPQAFVPKSSAMRRDIFSPQVVPALKDIEKSVARLFEMVDEDAARETLASLLGYYVSKAGDIRCQKTEILNGLCDWAVKACGLQKPPHFSDAFLKKLGFYGSERQSRDARPRRSFGDREGSRDGRSADRQSSFGGRSEVRQSSFGGRREDRQGGYGGRSEARQGGYGRSEDRQGGYGGRGGGRSESGWGSQGGRQQDSKPHWMTRDRIPKRD